MIDWMLTNWKEAVEALLMLLGGFSIIAKFTPTEADDRLIQRVLGFIHGIGLTKDKAK